MSLIPLLFGTAPPTYDAFGEFVLAAATPSVYYPMSDEFGPTAINIGTATGMDVTGISDPTFAEAGLMPGLAGSIEFDGTSALGAAQGIVNGADPTYSVGAWVQTTGTGEMVIVQQRDAAAFLGEWVMQTEDGGDAGKLRVWAVNTASGTEFDFLSPTAINDGEPHLVGFTVDGTAGTVRMYIDGVEVANDLTITGGSYSNALNLYIGRDERDNSRGWIGHISDVFVGPTALSADQWWELYYLAFSAQEIEVGSIDAAVTVTGLASIELGDSVETTQYIDVPSIDASSTPVGGEISLDDDPPPVPLPPDIPDEEDPVDPTINTPSAATPPALKAEIRTRGGSLVAALADVTTLLSWTDPMNGVGSGQVAIPSKDARGHSMVIGNDIWFSYHDKVCFQAPIMKPVTRGLVKQAEEDGQQWSFNGPGLGQELDWATLLPYKGNVDKLPLNPQHRLYSFASPDFPNTTGWRVAVEGLRVDEINPVRFDIIEYHTIIQGVNPGDPEFEDIIVDNVVAPAPLEWVVGEARWIWGTADTDRVGKNYFRRLWHVPVGNTYMIDVTADNYYTFYVDGQPLLGENEDIWTWKKFSRHTLELGPGDHQLACAVDNPGGIAGLAVGIWTADNQGNYLQTELISDSSWEALPYPVRTPGWTATQVLLDMLEEMQDRGLLPNWVFDFKEMTDYDGNAMPFMEYFSQPIGNSVLDALIALTDQGWINWRVLPGRRLAVWNRDFALGTGGASMVQTTDTVDQLVQDVEYTGATEPVSHLHVKWGDGSILASNMATATTYGPKEAYATIDGGTREEVDRQIAQELERLSAPTYQITATNRPLSIDTGPYWAYEPGQFMLIDDYTAGTAWRTIQSITVSLVDDPEPNVGLELEERRFNQIFRPQQLLQTLGGGVVGDPIVKRNTGLSWGRTGSGSAHAPATRPLSGNAAIKGNNKIYLPENVVGGSLAELPPFSFGGVIVNSFNGAKLASSVYKSPPTDLTITQLDVTLADLDAAGGSSGPIFKMYVGGVAVYTSIRITANDVSFTSLNISIPAGSLVYFEIHDHGNAEAINLTIHPRWTVG